MLQDQATGGGYRHTPQEESTDIHHRRSPQEDATDIHHRRRLQTYAAVEEYRTRLQETDSTGGVHRERLQEAGGEDWSWSLSA